MPRIDFVAESPVSTTPRVRQLEAMFNVPIAKRSKVEWHADVPLDQNPWNVGLIVGPSGAGKSTLARQLFGDAVDVPLHWEGMSVIDDFAAEKTMDEISRVCQAVGFNTIPSWMRPFSVLSTGERFRVELARRLLEHPDPIVVDEFTSVVDRQVAQIGSHAVQKYIRRENRKFVAVTCHYDVVDWLQPDWTFEPATATFHWRSVQPRPQLRVEIARVHRSAWKLFSKFHYLTSNLHRSAKCFCLFAGGRPTSFAAVIHRPNNRVKDIKGVTRAVTLPDWQGLGLIFALLDLLGAAYKAMGYRLHIYPAHPAFIRAMDRSPRWRLTRPPATYNAKGKRKREGLRRGATEAQKTHESLRRQGEGLRPCATFCYAGESMADRIEARMLLGGAA